MLSLLLFSYSSCTDQGCIEAEDFGEYEQEVLTIKANALGESCDYHPDQTLDGMDQGSGLKTCFISGNIDVADENNNTYTSTTGCAGFEKNVVAKNICIQQCRQTCINNNSSDSSGAEPDWVSTSKKQSGKNIGVTITPGAKIYIRAIGKITLGGDKPSPIFTKSTENSLQSKKNDFTGLFVDLKRGVPKDVKFSGKLTYDSSSSAWGGDISSTDSAEKARAFNGARRLVAYTIPHPLADYRFDTSQASEIAGTQGTPLFADDRLWQCSYTNADLKQSSCLSLAYNTTNGWPNTNNIIAQGYYGLDSTKQSSNLEMIGGMIRWDNDGLEALNIDPFSVSKTTCGITCTPLPSPTAGGIIGDLSTTTNASIKNNQPYAVRLLFKNLGSVVGTDNCSLGVTPGTTALSATYKNSSGNITQPAQNITTNKTGWSTSYISLEPGETITFAANAANFGGTNCGKVIAYRLIKLQDIPIDKSGFVKFTRLATSGSSGSCYLNGRIINPKGDRTDDAANAFDNDFYEYDSFATNPSTDPINNLNIPISNSTNLDAPFDKTWSEKIFVRKGQVIRFDPSSWNGTWSTGSGGTRQCGIGTVMKVGGIDMTTGKIDYRPAFLCRGNSEDQIPNPLCRVGTDQKCQAYSEDCGYDSITELPKNTSKFCPIESCQTLGTPAADCLKNTPFTITQNTCNQCQLAKEAAAAQPTTIPFVLDQCYDLENYTGKVSNIDNTTGFTQAQLADSIISKGAKKLGSFDGTYGNFNNLSDTGTKESTTYNSNKIYHLDQPLYPNVDSRLLFLIIDNTNFTELSTSYGNNGSSAAQYNGLNGYKIDLSGQQQFSNGQWLEAILCQENSDGQACSSYAIPTQVNGQPNIIKIADPVSTGQDPQVNSYYQFDPFGSISRSNTGSAGVYPDGNILSQTAQGDNFYRHSYDGTSSASNANNSSDAKSDRLSNLKISFKIKDSEVPNCDIGAPALGQNSCDPNKNCGVVVENRFYDGSAPTNVNQICGAGTTIGGGATDCKKQFFCANKYYNNSGQYQVVVKVENKNSNISDIVNQVVSPVVEIMDGSPDGKKIGQAERVYKEIVGDGRFQAIVQLMVILMITFYGVGYLMGVSEFTQGEIVSRIIKIGVIYLFINPQGWEWFDKFFVNFFKHGTDYVTFVMASSFDRSAELSNAIANNSFADKSILFGGIDKVFGMFFASAVQKKISALLFASIFGPVYLYIIYLSFFLYVYAVANAVLLYLTAQVFISILFVLGPLFFIMLLFNQTKEMFDKWLSELIGFSLQQIFLLTTLAFFNMMMYEIIKMALGYRICWDDVWVINIYITRIKLLSFWTIASMPSRLSLQSDIGNIGNPEGIPSLFSILFIYIIASLMYQFIDFMTNLGASIGGSLKASAMGAGVKAAANVLMKKADGFYQDKIGKHIDDYADSADRYLFDSGKQADEDRKAKDDQLKGDRTNRSTLKEAGDAAISEFKKDPANALRLANASPKEQNKMLQEHRNEAMKKKATAMDMSDGDFKRATEKKSEFSGDTLMDAVENAWKDRDIRDKSMSEEKADTKLSGTEFSAALKKANPEEKTKLEDSAVDGKLKLRIDLEDRKNKSFDQAGEELGKGNYKNAAVFASKGVAQYLGAKAAAITKPLVTPFKEMYKAGKNLTKKSYEGEARKELFPEISTHQDDGNKSAAESRKEWDKGDYINSSLKTAESWGEYALDKITSPYNDEQKDAIKDRAEEMYQQKKYEKPVSKETIDFVGRSKSSSAPDNAEPLPAPPPVWMGNDEQPPAPPLVWKGNDEQPPALENKGTDQKPLINNQGNDKNQP